MHLTINNNDDVILQKESSFLFVVQFPPVECNSYHYFNNEIVKEICDYSVLKLEYKDESSRFDRISFEKAWRLLKEERSNIK